MATCLGEAIIINLGNARLIPWREVERLWLGGSPSKGGEAKPLGLGRALTLAKKTSDFWNSMYPPSSASSPCSNLQDPFFHSQCPHFNSIIHVLLGVQLALESIQSQDEFLCLIINNFNPTTIGDQIFYQDTPKKLSGPLHSLIFQMFKSITYRVTQLLPLITGWLGVSVQVYYIPCHKLQMLSLLLEIESLLSLIRLEDQFQKSQNEFIKLSSKSCPFRTTFGIKICPGFFRKTEQIFIQYVHTHIMCITVCTDNRQIDR